MKSFRLVALATAVAFLGGCFKHTYTLGTGAPTSGTPRFSEWRHFFIGGLIGSADVDVRAICPSGNATIVNYHGFIQQLLAYIVLGGWIWNSTTVEVYCSEGGATSTLTIPAEKMNAFIRTPEFREAVALEAPEQLDAVLAALALSPADAACAAR
jgi:hypothetical protein